MPNIYRSPQHSSSRCEVGDYYLQKGVLYQLESKSHQDGEIWIDLTPAMRDKILAEEAAAQLAANPGHGVF